MRRRAGLAEATRSGAPFERLAREHATAGGINEQFRTELEQGGVFGPGWPERAAAVHQAFVARGLSPGGSADLLAAALLVERLGGGAR